MLKCCTTMAQDARQSTAPIEELEWLLYAHDVQILALGTVVFGRQVEVLKESVLPDHPKDLRETTFV